MHHQSTIESPALTFDLLFWPSGVTGSSRHAHIVPVNVLQKYLSVPPSQSAGLKKYSNKNCNRCYVIDILISSQSIQPCHLQIHYSYSNSKVSAETLDLLISLFDYG